jgi:hypothetical protein
VQGGHDRRAGLRRCLRRPGRHRQEGTMQASRGYTWAEPGYRVTQPTDRFLLASCSELQQDVLRGVDPTAASCNRRP